MIPLPTERVTEPTPAPGPRRTVRVALVVLAFAMAGASADADLADDLVEVRDGKFVYEEHSVCGLPGHYGWPEGIELRQSAYAEASADGAVSRDNFVAAIAVYLTAVEFRLATEVGVPPMQAFGAFDCETVDAHASRADVEIRMTVDGDGMQVEVLDTGSGHSNRSTLPWK